MLMSVESRILVGWLKVLFVALAGLKFRSGVDFSADGTNKLVDVWVCSQTARDRVLDACLDAAESRGYTWSKYGESVYFIYTNSGKVVAMLKVEVNKKWYYHAKRMQNSDLFDGYKAF